MLRAIHEHPSRRPRWAASLTLGILAALVARCADPSPSAEASPAKPVAAARAAPPAAPAGPHHAVFSLLDNRLLAHLVREGGLAVPLGHPGVAKYVNFNRPWSSWTLNREVDGRHVALAERSVTWLGVPLTATQARATALWLSLRGAADQGLSVVANGKALAPARVTASWQRVQIPVPSGALREGENRLELRWGKVGRFGKDRAHAAVEWLHLGERALPEDERVQVLDGARLALPPRGGVAYYVHPYRGARLKVRFERRQADKPCELLVSAQRQGQPAAMLLRSEADRGELFADLAAVAGDAARVEITAEGPRCGGLALVDAAIVMPGTAPLVKRGAAPRNVLFWLVDNARADRYRQYNPATRVKTPVFDQLAATGALFARAYIQGNESRVSHASIWTGLYPKQHNFIDAKAKLSLGWVTLPEALRKAGLFTAAWIANGFVSEFWGFGEGWDRFRNTLHKGGGLHAEALANHAAEFVNKQGDRPFYLYVGTIDPHVSWRGRQPWLDEYHPEPYSGEYKNVVWGKDVEKMATGARKTTPADRKRILAVYDSTVSYNDHHLGRVLKALESKGVREQTMVVVTADHGEELWDFGRIGHGSSIREQLVAVPLLVHYPPLFGKGVRVMQGVDVLSIMATVLDAVGAPLPDTVQGGSLLPLAQGVGQGYPRPAFASQYELAHAMRSERYKLRVGGKGATLYDLESAQGERGNVAAQRPLALRWLTDALSTFLVYQSRWRQSRWGVATNQLAAMPAELEQGQAPPPITAR
jgi:arylsulfatase A-like enzyme